MPKPKQDKKPMIEAGLQIFYNKGYNATGMQEIALANNMTKGAMYGYFSSKEEFVIEALSLYTEQTVAYLEDNLLNATSSPIKNLLNLLESWARNLFTEHSGCGCFAGNMAQEMGNASEKIRLATRKSFDSLESVYAQCIRQAVKSGELPNTTDERLTASIIFNGWQGALVRAKAEQDSTHLLVFIDYLSKTLLRQIH